MLKTSTLSA